MTRAEALSTLHNQVQRAHYRMTLQRFVTVLAWSLFATTLVAAVAIAVPKLWALPLAPAVWFCSWLGGSLIVGLSVAAIWTCVTNTDMLHAAIEVDQRYNLKERVSSSLAVSHRDVEDEATQALLTDAARRVERIDVVSEFPVRFGWRSLLPIAPTILALLLVLLPNAQRGKKIEAAERKVAARKQIQTSTETLKKKVLQKKKQAEKLELREAEGMFDQLTKGLDELRDLNDGTPRDALRKLSNLSSDLQKRRQLLGGAEQMKKQFNQLKNLKPGPADKFAKAIKSGDLARAIEALKGMQQALEQGEMGEADQKQLAEQLKQMSEKLQQMADAHQQAKKQLERRIAEAKQRGDMDQVNKLQQKLVQMNQQNQQMKQMAQMAQKLSQCSECMGQGQADIQAAMTLLNQLANSLDQMQRDNNELEMLDEALDQIAMAKDSMNCQQCGGMGCQACQGGMNGMFGMGLGQGRGKGDRPEEETNTSFYETKVKADPSRGKAVIVGQVRGPNVAGDARVEIQEQIEAFQSNDGDPLTGQRLPKSQRDHVQEYFRAIKSDD